MPRVTLTFDNGPTPGITERVLDSLDRVGAKASFFVIAGRLRAPDALAAAREAHARGHWIGNHTLTHTVALGDRPDAAYAQAEIVTSQECLGGLARPEKLFRPYGNDGLLGPHLFSRAALRLLQEGRYTSVLWTAVPGDWRDPDGWVERLLAQTATQAWSVVVLHDIPVGCVDRLDEALDRLRERGVVFVQHFPDAVIATRDGAVVSLDPAFVADHPRL